MLLTRWTNENKITNIPKLGSAGGNLYWIEDGSFVRLDNIHLQYSFPCARINFLSGADVFASIQNAYVWTTYQGFDPDVNAAGNNATQLAVDRNSYPKPRSFTFGLNIKF